MCETEKEVKIKQIFEDTCTCKKGKKTARAIFKYAKKRRQASRLRRRKIGHTDAEIARNYDSHISEVIDAVKLEQYLRDKGNTDITVFRDYMRQLVSRKKCKHKKRIKRICKLASAKKISTEEAVTLVKPSVRMITLAIQARIIRRKGRIFVVDKKNPKFKQRQG